MSYIPPNKIQEDTLKIYSEIKNKELDNKTRRNIPIQEMPAQDPSIRSSNVEEVALGYSKEQAIVESARCIQCKNAPCIKGCPVGINIPAFLKESGKGDFQSAVNIIKESSLLPAICGRVCPQETQCMKDCTVGKLHKDPDKSVAIGRVERFVADWEIARGEVELPEIKPESGKKVAIIG